MICASCGRGDDEGESGGTDEDSERFEAATVGDEKDGKGEDEGKGKVKAEVEEEENESAEETISWCEAAYVEDLGDGVMVVLATLSVTLVARMNSSKSNF